MAGICLLVCGIPESYYMEQRDQIDEVKEIYLKNEGKDKYEKILNNFE